MTPPQALLAATAAIDLWHQQFGHHSGEAFSHALHSFQFRCNKPMSSHCHACQLGKMLNFPFTPQIQPHLFLSNLFTAMYGHLLFQVLRVFSIISLFLMTSLIFPHIYGLSFTS